VGAMNSSPLHLPPELPVTPNHTHVPSEPASELPANPTVYYGQANPHTVINIMPQWLNFLIQVKLKLKRTTKMLCKKKKCRKKRRKKYRKKCKSNFLIFASFSFLFTFYFYNYYDYLVVLEPHSECDPEGAAGATSRALSIRTSHAYYLFIFSFFLVVFF
jgi:hypothetical protein